MSAPSTGFWRPFFACVDPGDPPVGQAWMRYDLESGELVCVDSNGDSVLPAGGAPLNSPAFTGVPTAPTAAPGTDTTQLATTAFVEAALAPLIFRKQVTITAAELLAMAETPINIIPAQGPGTMIDIRGCTFQLKFGTTAYTTTATALALVYHGGDPTAAALAGISPSILAQTANAVSPSVDSLADFGIGIVAETVAGDVAVDLATDTDPTLGDSTLVVTVDYAVIPLL